MAFNLHLSYGCGGADAGHLDVCGSADAVDTFPGVVVGRVGSAPSQIAMAQTVLLQGRNQRVPKDQQRAGHPRGTGAQPNGVPSPAPWGAPPLVLRRLAGRERRWDGPWHRRAYIQVQLGLVGC